MDYQLLTEIDIILDEIKEWETELETTWTPQQRAKYLNLKLQTFQNFFNSQKEYWDKELNGGGGTNEEIQPELGVKQEDVDNEELKEKERAAAERKAQIQKAVAEKLAADKLNAEKEAEKKLPKE